MWKASSQSIIQGKWCKKCSTGLSERVCLEVFEQLFGCKFNSKSPFWLINDNGNQLFYDGYSSKLKIAFEHHGTQHYQDHFFNDYGVEMQVQKDKKKEKLSIKHNVKLIVIPVLFKRTKVKNLKSFIKEQCRVLGIKTPENFDNLEINLRNAYLPRKYFELKEIARIKGGDLLSASFLGTAYKLEWLCKYGHKWKAKSSYIEAGYWCQICEGNKRDVDYYNKIAMRKKGVCLATEFTDVKQKVKWKCSREHIWTDTFNSIKNGRWCKECNAINHKNKEFHNMKVVAQERNGLLLSREYTNSYTKLKWKCIKHNYIWEAVPQNIKRGQWCLFCGRERQAFKVSKEGRVKLQ